MNENLPNQPKTAEAAEKPPELPVKPAVTAETRSANVRNALQNLFANDSLEDLQASTKHWQDKLASGVNSLTAERMLKKINDEINRREGAASPTDFIKKSGDFIVTQDNIMSGQVETTKPNLGLEYLQKAAAIADGLPQRAADLKARQAAQDAELDAFLQQHGKSLN